jgi:plastocyanin
MVLQRSSAGRSLLSAALAAALLAAVACGGSSGGSGGAAPAGATKVTMSEFKFDPSSINVKAGKVSFFLVNAGSQGHDMVISDSSGKVLAKSDLVQGGNSTDFTVSDLPAATYTIYCDVPGHRASGMQGTLTAS